MTKKAYDLICSTGIGGRSDLLERIQEYAASGYTVHTFQFSAQHQLPEHDMWVALLEIDEETASSEGEGDNLP